MTASRGRTALVAGAMILAVVAAAGIVKVAAGWHRPGATVAGGTASPSKAPVPPVRGAYFGARVRPPVLTQPAEIAAVQHLQGEIGRRLDIVHVFHMWQDPFPASSDLAFLRQGSMLLLSWSGADTRAIAAGKYDSLIRQRALAVKASGRRIFLEWRWEMDRRGLRAQVHSPADYIAAWDHIRSIFTHEQVDNVAWVWCPTASGFANGAAGGTTRVTTRSTGSAPTPTPARAIPLVRDRRAAVPELGVPSPQAHHDRRVWGASRYLRAVAAGAVAPGRRPDRAGPHADQGTGLLRRERAALLRADRWLARAASVPQHRPCALLQPGQSAQTVSSRAPSRCLRCLALVQGRTPLHSHNRTTLR